MTENEYWFGVFELVRCAIESIVPTLIALRIRIRTDCLRADGFCKPDHSKVPFTQRRTLGPNLEGNGIVRTARDAPIRCKRDRSSSILDALAPRGDLIIEDGDGTLGPVFNDMPIRY